LPYLLHVVSRGFEPRLPEPKSGVLPLHYETIKNSVRMADYPQAIFHICIATQSWITNTKKDNSIFEVERIAGSF
jgi:hypothetical protein